MVASGYGRVRCIDAYFMGSYLVPMGPSQLDNQLSQIGIKSSLLNISPIYTQWLFGPLS